MGREVRIRQLPERFDGKCWHTKPQAVVRLGDVGRWSMCRVAEHPSAMPFVMSRKEWDKLEIETPNPHDQNTREASDE